MRYLFTAIIAFLIVAILATSIFAIFTWYTSTSETASYITCSYRGISSDVCPILFVCGSSNFLPICTFQPWTWIVIHILKEIPGGALTIAFPVVILMIIAFLYGKAPSKSRSGYKLNTNWITKKKIVVAVIILVSGLLVFGMSRYLSVSQKPVSINYQGDGPALLPPENGLDFQTKSIMLELLGQIVYLQPHYIPTDFYKVHDLPDNSFALYTDYRHNNIKDTYASLIFTQYKKGEKWNSLKELKNDMKKVPKEAKRFTYKEIKINNKNGLYVEQPAHLIDPGYDMNFSNSLAGKKYATGTDKYLYWFENDGLKELKISFVFDFTTEYAQRELVQMAESMVVGKSAGIVVLSNIDRDKLLHEKLRHAAPSLKNAINTYNQEFRRYPWEGEDSCYTRGTFQDFTPVQSTAFENCLVKINEYAKDPLTDPEVLSRLYVYQNARETFYQRSFKNEDIEIRDSNYAARICYRAFVLSDYVASYLNTTPRAFESEYPMFNREGKVDLNCKDNPIENNCYYCTN